MPKSYYISGCSISYSGARGYDLNWRRNMHHSYQFVVKYTKLNEVKTKWEQKKNLSILRNKKSRKKSTRKTFQLCASSTYGKFFKHMHIKHNEKLAATFDFRQNNRSHNNNLHDDKVAKKTNKETGDKANYVMADWTLYIRWNVFWLF